MFHTKKFFQYSALLIIGLTTLVGCGSDSDEKNLASKSINTEDCFWVGPYSKENEASNKAFPDDGARYWHAGYTVPEGASLKLKGTFPYARYMGLNSYYGGNVDDIKFAAPAHSIADSAIEPDTGSINPFIHTAQRNSEFRDYQVTLDSGVTPEQVEENTIYGNAEADNKTIIIYRVYVPDTGKNAQGGVPLPQAELTLENGEVLIGKQACNALNSDTDLIETPFIPDATYSYLRAAGNPAINNLIENNEIKTVRWRAAYNATFANKCSFLNQCESNPERAVNWYANLDNQYAAAFIDREIKPVVVIRGKLPAVPTTLAGNTTFDVEQAQLRYWSICQNEYFSQKVTQCLFDEQITIQPDGRYLIVTSLLTDKPSNISTECGIDYLEWSEDGDGFAIREGKENNSTDGLLIVRNMLPVNDFDQAVQNTAVPGDEKTIMGEYLPTAQYFTKAEFEALGCDAYSSL